MNNARPALQGWDRTCRADVGDQSALDHHFTLGPFPRRRSLESARKAFAILPLILVVTMMGLAGSTALAHDTKATGREIIERYLARQSVDSELAFIAMTISRPGMAKKEHRFLIAYR